MTTIDRAGRVVIPKEIREKMHLRENSILLLAETDTDALILKKFDVEEIAKRLRAELKGKDVDKTLGKVEAEWNERGGKDTPQMANGCG